MAIEIVDSDLPYIYQHIYISMDLPYVSMVYILIGIYIYVVLPTNSMVIFHIYIYTAWWFGT